MSSFCCPHCRCHPNDYSFYQVVQEIRQFEVTDIDAKGEITYADEDFTVEYATGEPLPDGTTYKGGPAVTKLDFFFCASCKGTFTSEDFMPVTPEKIAAALTGLDDLFDELAE